MGNVINFRQARKAKLRADKARQAEENRARFGRTKMQKAADAEEARRRVQALEGALREKGEDGSRPDRPAP